MKVIGAVGRNGSGKDELIAYLRRRCGVRAMSVGDIVRKIAASRGVEPTRENLHRISRECLERKGGRIFMETLVERIREFGQDQIGISGIRTPTDVEVLRDHFGDGLLLVHVAVSDPWLRFERSASRDEARDPDSYETFREQDREEEELFHLSETLRRADLVLPNDGGLEAFRALIEERLIPLLSCPNESGGTQR